MRPSSRPSGIATAKASRNPTPTRISDAPMWSQIVPSTTSSLAPVTTSSGVGKIALFVDTTTYHQVARSRTIKARAGSVRERFFVIGEPPSEPPDRPHQVARAPAQALPGGGGLLGDDDGHLAAQVRRARELVFRGHLEG